MTRDEFFDRVYEHSNGCWVWLGFLKPDGYGRIRENRKWIYVHRYSYELHRGPIPTGMVIDHLCFYPACVNPDHLRVTDPVSNSRRQRSAFKTTCKNGHPFDEKNTIIRRANGRRDCRKCGAQATKRYEQRRRASESAQIGAAP